MPSIIIILYLLLVASIVQAVGNWLEYRRTRLRSKLLCGCLGFVLLSAGFSFLIIMFGIEAEIDRRTAYNLFRLSMVCGSILWMADSILWFGSRVEIKNNGAKPVTK